MKIFVQSRALRGAVAGIALLVSFSAAAAVHTAGPRDTVLRPRAEAGVRFAALQIPPEDLQAGAPRRECARYRVVGPRNTVRTCQTR